MTIHYLCGDCGHEWTLTPVQHPWPDHGCWSLDGPEDCPRCCPELDWREGVDWRDDLRYYAIDDEGS